jgi:hypothetical protein
MDTLYCGKCKSWTSTYEPKIVVYTVRKTTKSGDESLNERKVMKGICTVCGSKKHIFTNNKGEIKIPQQSTTE